MLIALFAVGYSAQLSVPTAHASMIPTITLSNLSNGSIQVYVTGDSYSSVNLYYYPSGTSYAYGNQGQNLGSIGTTNANGYLSTVVSTSYANFSNIPYNALVYVIVDGQQSSPINWPYYPTNGNGTNVSPVTFSQNNISLATSQSLAISLYPSIGYTFYISSNSNQSVATASISGNTITVTGMGYGSTIITVCPSVNTYPYTNGISQCGTLYVSVTSSGISPTPVYNGNIYFTVSNVSLTQGQNQSIQIYTSNTYPYGTNNSYLYNNGSYYVSSNTNSSVVSATISGNQLSIYGLSAGNSTITVCSNGQGSLNYYSLNQCATMTITVTYNNIYGYNGYNPYPTYQQYIPATVYNGYSNNRGYYPYY